MLSKVAGSREACKLVMREHTPARIAFASSFRGLDNTYKGRSMLIFDDLDAFFRSLMRYIGNGYTDAQISVIPHKKVHKIKHIDVKLRERYKSDLTSGKRQYRRKKGLANYAVLRFRDKLYIVLKSPGKDELDERWKSIYKTPLQLGDILRLEVIRDERGKNTVKIEKNLLKEIRSSIFLAIEKRDGRRFHSELNKLYNLHKVLKYRGIAMQLSSLLRDIKIAQKKHGTSWSVPTFFYGTSGKRARTE